MRMNLSAFTKTSMGILMVMIFVIPQSFMWLKLPFLGVVLKKPNDMEIARRHRAMRARTSARGV